MGPRVHPRLDRNGDNRIRHSRRVPLPDTCAELGKVETGKKAGHSAASGLFFHPSSLIVPIFGVMLPHLYKESFSKLCAISQFQRLSKAMSQRAHGHCLEDLMCPAHFGTCRSSCQVDVRPIPILAAPN